MYCCITIDYLSQLERSGVHEAGAFIDELKGIAAAFDASVGPRKSPLILELRLGGMFDGIQAAELLRRVANAIDTFKHHLRGVSVVVHDASSAEEALEHASSVRRSHSAEYSFLFSPQASARLSDYFSFSGTGWIEPGYATVLADADAGKLFERPRLAATISRAIASSERKGPRLVHLDSGPGVRSIDTMASTLRDPLREPAAALLLLGGTKTRPLPFSPLAEAISALLGENGPGLDSAKAPAFKFAASSSFAGIAPDSVNKGCAAYMNHWLDKFGESGGRVICDDPELFTQAAIELIGSRLADERGAERYISIADGPIMDRWTGPWAARVTAGFADSDDRPATIVAALGNSDGPARKVLEKRFEMIAEGTGANPSRQRAGHSARNPVPVLHILPLEAALYLHALSVSGNELSPAEFSSFIGGLGLHPMGEELLLHLLIRSGLVEPGDSRSPIGYFGAGDAESMIGTEAVELIERRLSAFLVGLYKNGRIRPSLGLLRKVGERPDDERLLYDCLFEDILRPDRSHSIDPGFLSPSSACVHRFWTAMMARDRPACESAAASAEERISGARGPAVRALVKAEFAYAIGDAERSSKGAREALLALGKGAPPKLEARSQRMMGLAALAMGKHTEASDYLTNAQELSESAGDEYERMMAAYAKAVVEFLWGALVKSLKALDCAGESASRLFRVDMAAAITAMRGRIDMELGSYDEAAQRFATLAEAASEYGLPEARRRASIWRGRALAYAGNYEEAARTLEREAGIEGAADQGTANSGDTFGGAAFADPEAMVFRGELEILRGRPHDARQWLETPAEPMVRPFGPPDSFEWSSLFSEIEGRSIGFDSADAPLAELCTALSLFARGLDERDPDCAVELHALTRAEHSSKINPGMGTYSFFCYLLEERLPEPPVDKQTVLSRAFKTLQQRAGRIEDRGQRGLYMENNAWNKRLLEAARTHKFI
jgi:tetratricopeptide (TPR) repeat protein